MLDWYRTCIEVAKQRCASCITRKQLLQRGCAVAPMICLEPISVPHTRQCTITEGVMTEVPESMMFADDIMFYFVEVKK